MSTSGSGSPGSSSTGSSGSSSSINLTRRKLLGGIGAAGGAAVGGWLLSRDSDIPGYEDQSEFDEHTRVLQEAEKQLAEVSNEYDNIQNKELSDLLQGETMRVGQSTELNSTNFFDADSHDLTYSENPSSTGGELPNDVVQDPAYMLSFEGEGSTFEIVNGDGDTEASEQRFTAFDGTDIGLDFESDIVEEYGMQIESDIEAAQNAFKGAQGARVMVPTTLSTQQPVVNPATLESALDDIEELEEDLENTYEEAVSKGMEIDQYQNELTNGLEDAEKRKGVFGVSAFGGGVEDKQQAEQLLERTNELNTEYQDFTTNVAANLAETRVMKEAVSRAYNRSEEIFNNSEYSSIFQEVEVEGEDMTGVKLGEVRNWDSIDNQAMGDDNYLQGEADDLGLDANETGKMVVVYDGEDTYLANPENGEYTESHLPDGPDGQDLFEDISDGVYDGSLEG
ncbi:MAG: hypothetical protein ACI977_000073 [Candidatus Nanohaloarchaea archaeon]|jgi:hypothetical protein